MDLLVGRFFKVSYHTDCLLGCQMVPLLGESELNMLSTECSKGTSMLFFGHSG